MHDDESGSAIDASNQIEVSPSYKTIESAFNSLLVDTPELPGDDLLIERFLTARNGRALSEHTIRAYQRDISVFRAWLRLYATSKLKLPLASDQEVPFRVVNTIVVEDYVKYVREDMNYKSRTVRRMVNVIRSLFKYGTSIGYFSYNPAAPIKAIKDEQRQENWEQTRILRRHQVRRLVEAAESDPTHSLIVKVLLSTGVRVSELVSLRWCDIKDSEAWEDSTTVYRYFLIHGKGDKERKTKILPQLWEELCKDRIRRGLPVTLNEEDTSPVIVSRLNKAYTDVGVRKIIKKLGKEAGVPKVSPHWFRHTCASYALRGGASLQYVKELLGHSNFDITQIYLHSIDGLAETAADYLPEDLWW